MYHIKTECHFSAVSIVVYTALIHSLTCWLEARQALIYQLVLGLTGENGKYNYSRAVHLYPPFFDISCSAKNYKIAPVLTVFVHVIRRKKSLCGEQRTDHDGAALYIHYIKGPPSRKAQPLREDAHNDGIPLPAGGMPEYGAVRAVGPEIFRLGPVGVLYVLRDTFTLR